MNKTVSVIIPSYNHENFVQQAVESVLGQTYQDLELIIIDDGSKDSSWDYLSQIEDERVKTFRQENRGAHNTINRGLAMAMGDYLAILNSDDQFTLDRLNVMMKYFEEHPRTDFLCSYIEIIDDHGKTLGLKQGWHDCEPWPIACPEKSYKMLDDFNYNIIMSNFVSTTSNIIMKRSAYEDVGGMRNFRFAHDWDFMLRMASQHKCEILAQPLVRYRIHGTNTINTNRKWLLFEICLVVAANLHLYEGEKLFNAVDQKSTFTEFSRLFHSLNFQGNEKFVCVLRSYLSSLRQQGVNAPEERLLDDEALRNSFIQEIVDEPHQAIAASVQEVAPTFRRKLGMIRDILFKQ